MHIRTTLLSLAVAALPALALAQEPSVITPYDGLEWAPISEGSEATVAVLWGDPETGPAALLIRVPPGYQSPLHAHHSDYNAVVLRGAPTHWDEGVEVATVAAMAPGDSFFQPRDAFHTDANFGDDEVLALVYFTGPVDTYTKD